MFQFENVLELSEKTSNSKADKLSLKKQYNFPTDK